MAIGSNWTLVRTLFNQAAPGANTDVLDAASLSQLAVGASDKPRMFRVFIAVTTSTVLNLSITDGSTTHVVGLNASGALNAADLYTFDFMGQPGLTYDLQYETDSVTEVLDILEIYS